MKINKIYYFLLGSAVVLSSCGGASTDESQVVEEAVVEEAAEEVAESEEETTYFLPSALQIGSVFQKSGLKYSDGVVNLPSNVTKYESKTSKLLNFGTYSADLAYCVLNGQSQVAMNQLRSLRTLSEGLGMESIFNSEAMFMKFENNMDNQDSIIDVMIQIQENMDMYIDDNDLQSTANIMFAGAWIEGMYIGVKATNEETEGKITRRLVEQMVILDNLVKALGGVDNASSEIESIKTQLDELQTYFNGLEEVKAMTSGQVKKVELSIDHLRVIADKIIEMRQAIVEPV